MIVCQLVFFFFILLFISCLSYIFLQLCCWLHILRKHVTLHMIKLLQELRYYRVVCPFTKQVIFLFPQERAALAAASDPYRYIEKRKPIPDPQVGTSALC